MVEQERVNRLREEKAQTLEDALSRVRATSRALGSEAGPRRLDLSTASGVELVERTLKVGQIRKSIHDKTVPSLATHLQEVRRSQAQYYLGELQQLSEEGYLTSREKRLAQKQLTMLKGERSPSLRKRRSNPELLQLFHGRIEILPRHKDLRDPDQFLSVKKAVGVGVFHYKGGLGALLPAVVAETDIVVVRYRIGKNFTYYVPTHQAYLLRERWHEYLAQHAPARLLSSSAKLVPEQAKELTDKIKARFGEEEPIFYSRDPRLRELLGVSRYTLSEILQLAQREDVIPIPHVVGGNKKRGFYYYSRSEILKALDYSFQLRKKGQGLSSTMRTLREKEKIGPKLTLRGAAQRLGVRPALLQSAITEGRINLRSAQVAESINRIKHPSMSRARLIDPTLLTPELVEKLTEGKNKTPLPLTHSSFQTNRASFLTVSGVFEMAYGGAHPNVRHVANMAHLLIENGVEVSYLKNKWARGGYWVLAKEDQEAAVRILKDNLI